MTVLLPEIAELGELSEFLGAFMNTELESTKLRGFMEKRAASEKSLWTKLKELDLATAFAQGGSPESSLPGLAQLAYECGHGPMPLPLWETLFAGPYLFGQLKVTDPKLPVAEIASGTKTAIPVPATAAKHPIRGLDQADFAVLINAASVDIFGAAASKASEDLDLVGTYGTFDAQKAKKLGTTSVPETYSTSFKLLVAAELSGIAAKAVKMTVDYLKMRKQFDVPVGGFQAVQHKAADMLLHAEAMAALVSFALRSFSKDNKEFTVAAESALSYACDYTGLVLESAIQLHGGIGFTWEHDLHLYLRRAKQLEFSFGPSDGDLSKLVQLVQ